MRSWVAMVVGLLAGCGSVAKEQSDASASLDAAAPDARATICDPTGKFDEPVPLAGFNTTALEGIPRLTTDELELYFYSNQGTGNDTNICRAQRSSVVQPFGTPAPVAPANSSSSEAVTTVSNDGLMLIFESLRVSGEGWHIYISTRTSRAGEFGAPSKLANVNAATATVSDNQPFVTADGQELWFSSTRAGGLGDSDIYRATWNGSSFANISAVTALSTTTNDYLPTFSADKLTIYLTSNRPGGNGMFDIWTAHRSTTTDGFPTPTPVAALNSTSNDFVGWLSPDNCRLYFSSDRAGTLDIYVASRHPM